MTVYQINKGVSKPIMFKGLKAQYIAYLAIGLVLLMLGFAVLYIIGLSLFVILPLIATAAMALFSTVTTLSRKFGRDGLMKYMAEKRLPRTLKFRSRRLFIQLKNRERW